MADALSALPSIRELAMDDRVREMLGTFALKAPVPNAYDGYRAAEWLLRKELRRERAYSQGRRDPDAVREVVEANGEALQAVVDAQAHDCVVPGPPDGMSVLGYPCVGTLVDASAKLSQMLLLAGIDAELTGRPGDAFEWFCRCARLGADGFRGGDWPDIAESFACIGRACRESRLALFGFAGSDADIECLMQRLTEVEHGLVAPVHTIATLLLREAEVAPRKEELRPRLPPEIPDPLEGIGRTTPEQHIVPVIELCQSPFRSTLGRWPEPPGREEGKGWYTWVGCVARVHAHVHHLALADLRATRLAAAIERFRLAHGHLPGDLADLEGECPLDPFTEGPFSYERRDGRRYTLRAAGTGEAPSAASGLESFDMPPAELDLPLVEESFALLMAYEEPDPEDNAAPYYLQAVELIQQDGAPTGIGGQWPPSATPRTEEAVRLAIEGAKHPCHLPDLPPGRLGGTTRWGMGARHLTSFCRRLGDNRAEEGDYWGAVEYYVSAIRFCIAVARVCIPSVSRLCVEQSAVALARATTKGPWPVSLLAAAARVLTQAEASWPPESALHAWQFREYLSFVIRLAEPWPYTIYTPWPEAQDVIAEAHPRIDLGPLLDECRTLIELASQPFNPDHAGWPAFTLCTAEQCAQVSAVIPNIHHAHVTGHLCARAALRGARLAVALAIFRQRHGECPRDLAELAPDAIDAVPEDPLCGAQFAYERLPKADEYRLSSVGMSEVKREWPCGPPPRLVIVGPDRSRAD